jgi:hypothetical protein
MFLNPLVLFLIEDVEQYSSEVTEVQMREILVRGRSVRALLKVRHREGVAAVDREVLGTPRRRNGFRQGVASGDADPEGREKPFLGVGTINRIEDSPFRLILLLVRHLLPRLLSCGRLLRSFAGHGISLIVCTPASSTHISRLTLFISVIVILQPDWYRMVCNG